MEDLIKIVLEGGNAHGCKLQVTPNCHTTYQGETKAAAERYIRTNLKDKDGSTIFRFEPQSDQAPYHPIGFGLMLSGRELGRVTSYSAYGGRHDALAKNCFGDWCQHSGARKLKIWQTRQAAEKNRLSGEEVVEIYPNNRELRDCLHGLFGRSPEALKLAMIALHYHLADSCV